MIRVVRLWLAIGLGPLKISQVPAVAVSEHLKTPTYLTVSHHSRTPIPSLRYDSFRSFYFPAWDYGSSDQEQQPTKECPRSSFEIKMRHDDLADLITHHQDSRSTVGPIALPY